MTSTTPEETITLLTRLSQKPGVQSTLILSRTSGAILRTSGLLSRDESASSDATTNSPAVSQSQSDTKAASADSKGTVTKDNKSEESNQAGLRNAEDVARLVWGFFGAAGGMVEEMMGTEDEVKLLRLRTRRNELVIVPDSKFLLVVVHDTPPA